MRLCIGSYFRPGFIAHFARGQRIAAAHDLVAGKRDQMTPPKAGRALAAEIPGAKLVVLDAGHSMMSEAPRETLKALGDFLA